MLILKDGTKLGAGNKSYYFFLEDITTGTKIARYPSYSRCKDEKYRQDNPDNFRVVGDWVWVRG